jgi:hypothetical protein
MIMHLITSMENYMFLFLGSNLNNVFFFLAKLVELSLKKRKFLKFSNFFVTKWQKNSTTKTLNLNVQLIIP